MKKSLRSIADVVGVLGMMPCTYLDIVARFKCLPDTAKGVLSSYRRVGLAHIAAFERRDSVDGRAMVIVPVYSRGAAADAPWPHGYRHRSPRKVVGHVLSVKALCELMEEGERSALELSQEAGIAHAATYEFVRCLRRAGMVRISAWTRPHDECQWIAVYALGSQRDKPKPRALTKAETNARYRAKQEGLQQHMALVRMTAGWGAANDDQQEAA